MNGAGFWQVGVVVGDLEAAMDEMGRALGLTWGEVKVRDELGPPLRVVFSDQGPPYFELIEGPPGSHWDGSAGSRLDHLAYWTDDLADERERLESEGLPVVVDGEAHGLPVNYHELRQSGFRIEMFDGSYREKMRAGRNLENVG
jgi:hypothetical protein